MPRYGLANRYAIARARARGGQRHLDCENNRVSPRGDGAYAADAIPGSRIGGKWKLLVGRFCRCMQIAVTRSHARTLAHVIALTFALIMLLPVGSASAQQEPAPDGLLQAYLFAAPALERSHDHLFAFGAFKQDLPRTRTGASRSYTADAGPILAQSVPHPSTNSRNPPPPGPDSIPADAHTGSDNPFAPAPFAPMLGFDAASAPVIRAQISPRRQTVLSAEIAGKIVDFNLREGDRFTAGDRLIGLDCAAHAARRDRARAQEQATRRRLETAGRLDQLSSISRLEYDEAVAALAAAEAESTLAEIFVARCAIVAPFDGRVSERLAEPYQYVSEGEPLIAILDDRDLEIELIAPSQWLVWLSPGHVFTLRVDELADDVTAQVSRLGARVDPVSQSVKVFATITAAPPGLMAGMSGLADLAPPPEAPLRGAPDG